MSISYVLVNALVIALFVAVVWALAAWARHDRFAGPAVRYTEMDDLGAVPDRNLVRL